ncbi:alpha/beta hydrolase [Oryzibacter oryziterrae]|uniref:alpha/beta hydrolase n=1 Tax=Oryzibacter oryziterrae TaxID=2766474 RepID=UPI001F3B25C9|nr:dienelactone hydrolase family protein [Oryzibacter oryziterrae]
MSNSLVILLHGVGSSGADLEALGEVWAGALPDAVFVAPDAPFAFDQSRFGYQWFSIAGVNESNRGERIVAAREAFDRTVSAAISGAGFTDRLDRVAFAGFSQGTIMALDALASGRWPVAAVVGFSGRLSSPEPFAPATQTKVLLVHGTADRVIPATESEQAESRLQQAGFTVERHALAGLGHTISPEGASLAGRFLSGMLG